MAITSRSLASLTPATAVSGADLFHVAKGARDLSASVSLFTRLVANIAFPVGVVESFANTFDPNTAFPGQKWSKLTAGNFRGIRIASSSGADVMQVGGTDKTVLQPNHLPAHRHAIVRTTDNAGAQSGTVSTAGNHNHGASTNTTGNHNHQDGQRAAGATWGSGEKGTNNDGYYPVNNTDDAGNHAHTIGIGYNGNHNHTIAFPSHTHLLSGSTAGRGLSWEFVMRDAYVQYYFWKRDS